MERADGVVGAEDAAVESLAQVGAELAALLDQAAERALGAGGFHGLVNAGQLPLRLSQIYGDLWSRPPNRRAGALSSKNGANRAGWASVDRGFAPGCVHANLFGHV